MIARLFYALRARLTWARGERALVPFCWGCGHIFSEDATIINGYRDGDAVLCLLCVNAGWRLSHVEARVDAPGIYERQIARDVSPSKGITMAGAR